MREIYCEICNSILSENELLDLFFYNNYEICDTCFDNFPPRNFQNIFRDLEILVDSTIELIDKALYLVEKIRTL